MNQVKGSTINHYEIGAIDSRIGQLQQVSGKSLKHINRLPYSPELTKGNIERLIGFTHVPVGMIGPIKVNGEHAKGKFHVPMATLEGALVSSYHRGARLLTYAGGVNVVSIYDAIQRAPIFVLKDVFQAKEFIAWCKTNFARIKKVAESTTRHGKLLEMSPYIAGHNVYMRFSFSTGDAMGMNMVTKAVFEACEFIQQQFPIAKYILESNMAVDKKPSFMNMLAGRGKILTAEALIPRKLISRFLSTTPEEMLDTSLRQLFGNVYAGAMGCNYQVANGVAALFLACGQDVANLVESGVGLTAFRLEKGDLYTSITLPSMIVGTVGGGTGLPTQRECLELMDCYGEGKAIKLAEIFAAVLLGGELSLAGSIVKGDFTLAHEKYGRNKPEGI